MPRTIQTKVFATAFKGLNLLIEQKAMGSPNGIPQSKVTAKMINEITKPFAKNDVTSKKVIIFSFIRKFTDGK